MWISFCIQRLTRLSSTNPLSEVVGGVGTGGGARRGCSTQRCPPWPWAVRCLCHVIAATGRLATMKTGCKGCQMVNQCYNCAGTWHYGNRAPNQTKWRHSNARSDTELKAIRARTAKSGTLHNGDNTLTGTLMPIDSRDEAANTCDAS